MDSRTFFRYVAAMREEQRKPLRSTASDRERRRLEGIIDAEIERVMKIVNPDGKQDALFGE